MTLEAAPSLSIRRDPGQIQVGDEVFLNLSNERNPLRRIALSALELKLGGSGPFTVQEVSGGRVALQVQAGEAPTVVALGSLTRERPLNPNHNHQFEALYVPDFRQAIKP